MPTTEYRSPQTRADFTMLLLGIYILLVAVIIVMTLNQISLLNGMRDSGVIVPQEIQDNLRSHSLITVVYVVNFVAIVVAFLMWMHRVSSNLRPLGVTRQKHSPRAAVFWWFVPIASWWMPYRVLREIHQVSQPVSSRVHPAFTAWWWLWLAGAYMGPLITRMMSADPYTDPDAYVARDWVAILFNLLLLGIAWFLFEIVRRTTENQELKDGLRPNSGELATEVPA